MPAHRARCERTKRAGSALLRIARVQYRAEASGTHALRQSRAVRTEPPKRCSGMTRLALLVVLLFAVAVAPAAAATHVSGSTRTGQNPPFWADYMRIIGISGDDGVNHHIVVKPS